MAQQRVQGPSFEALLETLPGIWFLVRRDNSLAYVTASATAVLQASPSALIAMDFGQFTFERPDEEAPLPLWSRLGQSDSTALSAWQRRTDGVSVPMTLLVRHFCLEHEPMLLVQAVECGSALAPGSAPSLSQLASGLAHDFNNLLQIIRGNLELFANLPLDKFPLELVSDIAQATERATLLVQQLLGLSQRLDSIPDPRTTIPPALTSGAPTERPSSKFKIPPNVSGHDRLVLVAEDDPQIRGLAARLLSRAGFRVVTAADGAEAELLLVKHDAELSLAILDAIMPRLRGSDVYTRLRARGSQLPCLIVTGYDRAALDELPPLERACLLQKPFDGSAFFNQLAELLHEG